MPMDGLEAPRYGGPGAALIARQELSSRRSWPGYATHMRTETTTESALPEISVGLPVYNGERFVATAIESVLAQDFAAFELMICDNASSDDTEAICRQFARRDSRVRYVRNATNLGAMGNFRRVFELTNGRYFRWLSADDYIGKQSLSHCKAVLDARPDVVLCCTQTDFVDADGRTLRHYDETQQLEQDTAFGRFRAANAQDPWCNAIYGLIRRDVLARTRLMGSFGGSDAVLLAELALYGRFAEVPERLFFRRIHQQAYSFEISTERMRVFYTPQDQQKRSLILYTWRHLLEHAKAVGRSPLSLCEHASLWLYLLRMLWWSRRTLSVEAADFARSLVHSRN